MTEYCKAKVLVPAVRPVTICVREAVMFVAEVDVAESPVEAATVDAPDTAKPRNAFDAEPMFKVADTVTSAVVPVEIVTDGFVPGVPERAAVKVVEVVVP